MKEKNSVYKNNGTLKAPTFQWASNILQRSQNKHVRKQERIAHRALLSKKKGAMIDWANGEATEAAPPVDTWLLVRLLMPAVLVEYMWTLGEMLMMPYLIDLGVPISVANQIWLVNPIIGVFVQPVLGSATDSCESRYGRRKPFILGLLVVIAGAFLLIAFTYRLTLSPEGWAELLGFVEQGSGFHIEGVGEENANTKMLVPWSFVLCIFAGYGVADLCIDCLLIPSRALVSDVLPPASSMKVNSLFGTVGSVGLFLALLIGCINFSHYPSMITSYIWPRPGETIVNSSAVNITVIFIISTIFVLITMALMGTVKETPYTRKVVVPKPILDAPEVVIHPSYGSLDDGEQEDPNVSVVSFRNENDGSEETDTLLSKNILSDEEEDDEEEYEDDGQVLAFVAEEDEDDAELSDTDSVVITMGSISMKIPLKSQPKPKPAAKPSFLRKLFHTAAQEVRSCYIQFLRFPSLLKRVWILSFATWFLYMTVINWLTTFVATNVLVLGGSGADGQKRSHSLYDIHWTQLGVLATPYPATTTLCMQLGILCMGALGIGMIVFGNIINILNVRIGPRIAFHICLSWFSVWVIILGTVSEAVTPLGCVICCFCIGSIFPALQSSPFIIANEYYSPDYLAVLFFLENKKLDKLLPLTYARIKNAESQEEAKDFNFPINLNNFNCIADDSTSQNYNYNSNSNNNNNIANTNLSEDVAEQALLSTMKKLHPDLQNFIMATNYEQEQKKSTQLLQEEGKRLQSKVLRHSRHHARVQARYLNHQSASVEPQTPLVSALLDPAVHPIMMVPNLDIASGEVNDPWTAMELNGDMLLEPTVEISGITISAPHQQQPAIGQQFIDSLVEDGFVGPQDRLFGVLSQPPSPPPRNEVMVEQHTANRANRTISVDANDQKAFQLEQNDTLMVTVASLNKTIPITLEPIKEVDSTCYTPAAATRMGLHVPTPLPVDGFGQNVLKNEEQTYFLDIVPLAMPQIGNNRSNRSVLPHHTSARAKQFSSKPSTPGVKPRNVLTQWPIEWEQGVSVTPPVDTGFVARNFTVSPRKLALTPTMLVLSPSEPVRPLNTPPLDKSIVAPGNQDIPHSMKQTQPNSKDYSKLCILANRSAEVEDAATLGKITAVMAISMTCAQIAMALTVGELISLLSLRNMFTVLAVVVLLIQAVCLNIDGATWDRDEIISKGLKARRRERKIALEEK